MAEVDINLTREIEQNRSKTKNTESSDLRSTLFVVVKKNCINNTLVYYQFFRFVKLRICWTKNKLGLKSKRTVNTFIYLCRIASSLFYESHPHIRITIRRKVVQFFKISRNVTSFLWLSTKILLGFLHCPILCIESHRVILNANRARSAPHVNRCFKIA